MFWNFWTLQHMATRVLSPLSNGSLAPFHHLGTTLSSIAAFTVAWDDVSALAGPL